MGILKVGHRCARVGSRSLGQRDVGTTGWGCSDLAVWVGFGVGKQKSPPRPEPGGRKGGGDNDARH